MYKNLSNTFRLLSSSDKKKGFIIVMMMLLNASFEIIGIGLILPFIALMSNPDIVMENQYTQILFEYIEISSANDFIIFLGISMVAMIGLKNIYFISLVIIQNKYLLNRQISIERRLLSSYLHREMVFHVDKNPAELYQNMRNVSGIVGMVMSPFLNALTDIILLVFVFALLFSLYPIVTITAFIFFSLLGFFLYSVIRNRIIKISEITQEEGISMSKWLFQSLGGVKEVKLLGREEYFIDKCIHHAREYARASMKGQIYNQIPRPFIEFVGFTVIMVYMISFLFLNQDASSVLPTLALFVAAAFRLIPAVNRIVNSAISIRQSSIQVDAVTNELDGYLARSTLCDISGKNKFDFNRNILLEDITYIYPSANMASLCNISLEIKKGESVAFVGPSGAGKTTLVDLIIGLNNDYKGDILVDDITIDSKNIRSWQQQFGYIPQSIYLSDDTIRRNIAFGLSDSEIDEDRILSVVTSAQLDDLITELPKGLNSIVGDRGTKLSGGQRQRIGIARALYNNPEILVLDEATSALDNETEREVSNAIQNLQGEKTVILIAHRLSTVVSCDNIFFMKNGSIIAQGNYSHLINTNDEFKRFSQA